MITVLLELVQKLVQQYKKHGLKFLIDSPLLPEFHQLVEHLAGITLKNVGITDDNHKEFFKKDATTYFNIMEEQDFCIGVFCLSAGSSLALHDHPNMLVVSKLLMGSVYHRSVDLIDRSHQVELPKQLMQEELTDVVGKKLEAIVRTEKVLKGGDIHFLTPDRGNIHKFTALENTAILDILLPNYNETDHYCNYYFELPIGKEGAEINESNFDGDDFEKTMHNIKQELMKYETCMHTKRDIYSESLASVNKGLKLNKPGDKTTLIYILPPLDEPIRLVPYGGEKFEYQPLKQELQGGNM